MVRQVLTVLHTNDLHSRFDAWATLAAMIRGLRQDLEGRGGAVLLLDAGDHLDFSNTLTYGTAGMLNVRLLADLGYHAFVPGNNETLRQPRASLCRLAEASRVPWLAANLVEPVTSSGGPTPLPGLAPSAVVSLMDLRIGIVGVTALFERIFPYLAIGWRDTHEAILAEVDRLREQGCDLIIALSHLGLDDDRALARAGLGLDLIVGGHSHHALAAGETVAGVPILQAGSHGRFLGQARLELERTAGDRWRLVGLEEQLLPVVAGAPQDEATLALLVAGKIEADAALANVVAILPADLDHDMVGSSRLGEQVAAALRERWQAEIGLVNGGAMYTGLQAGPVTRRAVLDSFPSLVSPGLVEILGEDLALLLEESTDPRFYGMEVWGAGLRGEGVVLGRVFTAGLTWTTDLTAPPGRRARDIRVQGEPLDPRRWYQAGTCTLLVHPEVGYRLPPRCRVLDRLWPDLVRDVFSEWLGSRHPPA
ncbi:MAG: bifunctional metallophosphatase/5'-nucleotidase [Symbiobacteriia bacterium]